MTIKIGCNAGIFADVQSVVPGVSTCRSYRDVVNDIPVVWPGVAGAQCATVSLRPDPASLLHDTPVPDNGSGLTTLYEQIQYLAGQAPATADPKLTIWHEAGNLYQGNPAITPSLIRQAHVKMKQACASSAVKYGVIIYGTIVDMDIWVPGYPHSQGVQGALPYPMDWYGIDLYDNMGSNNGTSFRDFTGAPDPAAVSGYLDMWLALARERTGLTWPQIDVCECNSPVAASRGPFFTAIAQWLDNNGGRRMQVFYKDGGASGGPWDPADQPAIGALNAIVSAYA